MDKVKQMVKHWLGELEVEKSEEELRKERITKIFTNTFGVSPYGIVDIGGVLIARQTFSRGELKQLDPELYSLVNKIVKAYFDGEVVEVTLDVKETEEEDRDWTVTCKEHTSWFAIIRRKVKDNIEISITIIGEFK